MSDDHEHVWGQVEHAHFTGNPHRKCTISGCNFISLDLYPERDGDPYWTVRGDDVVRYCEWTWDDRAELEGEIVADYRKVRT